MDVAIDVRWSSLETPTCRGEVEVRVGALVQTQTVDFAFHHWLRQAVDMLTDAIDGHRPAVELVLDETRAALRFVPVDAGRAFRCELEPETLPLELPEGEVPAMRLVAQITGALERIVARDRAADHEVVSAEAAEDLAAAGRYLGEAMEARELDPGPARSLTEVCAEV